MNDAYEIAVIGAGAAGYTAAIYAGRSGARTVVFDRGMGGGMTMEAPKVENWPGDEEVTGIELMERMKRHATRYAELNFGEEVERLSIGEKDVAVTTGKDTYTVGAAILCTGTTHRKLGVPGEEKLSGRGISYCATCDGFFFKGKQVAVVGGGSSAVIEAIYLRQIGMDVSVVHRRNELRAEKALETEARNKGVTFIWDSVVEEVIGDEKVDGVHLKNLQTGEEHVLAVDGVFVSIGEKPQSYLARTLGAKIDENGYVVVDHLQRTSIDRLLAAGDVTGGVRQIVTACAQGAKAALAAMPLVGKRSPF
jgi:thioredoxin reductase (NADPH)